MGRIVLGHTRGDRLRGRGTRANVTNERMRQSYGGKCAFEQRRVSSDYERPSGKIERAGEEHGLMKSEGEG